MHDGNARVTRHVVADVPHAAIEIDKAQVVVVCRNPAAVAAERGITEDTRSTAAPDRLILTLPSIEKRDCAIGIADGQPIPVGTEGEAARASYLDFPPVLRSLGAKRGRRKF